MALATVSNTGGNWDNTGTWVNASVPTQDDDILFDAASGPLYINVTASCRHIDFTNYANTIDFGSTISAFGNLSLGSNTYTTTGTYGIELRRGSTISTAGATWSAKLYFGGRNFTTYTFNILNNVSLFGEVAFNGSDPAFANCNLTFNGATVSFGGNIKHAAQNLIAGSSSFQYIGNGTFSLVASDNGTNGNVESTLNTIGNNFSINTDGQFTIAPPGLVFRTGTFSYLKGNVVTTNSKVHVIEPVTFNTTNGTNSMYFFEFQVAVATNHTANGLRLNSDLYVTSTCSLSSGMTFSGTGRLLFTNPQNQVTGNIEFKSFFANQRFGTTLPQSFTVSNLRFTNTSTNQIQLRTNTIFVRGDLYNNLASTGFAFGSTKIRLIGDGTWSAITNNGPIRNDITIDTPGQINLSGNINHNIGTISYVSGAVNTVGGNLIINGTTSLATSTASGTIYWDRISFTNSFPITLVNDLYVSGTLSLGTGTSSFSGRNILFRNSSGITTGSLHVFSNVTHNLAQTFTVSNLELGLPSSSPPITLNNNRINILGNLTSNSNSLAGSSTGSTTFYLIGTGSWNHPNNGGPVRNNLIIDTPGTLTLNNVYFDGKSLTYSTGNINTTNVNLYMNSSTSLSVPSWTWSSFNVLSAATITMNSNLITNKLVLRGAPTWNLGSNSILLNGGLEALYSGSMTLPHSLTASYLSLGTASATTTINSNTVSVTGDLIISNSGSGIITGTTDIKLIGSGTWSGENGTLRNNLIIDTSGVISITPSTVRYDTGTFSIISGSLSTNGSTVNIFANTTLDTKENLFNTISFSASTITLKSNLKANKFIMSRGITFSGTASFEVGTYSSTNTSTATHVFTSGLTYNVTNTFTFSGTQTILKSSVSGSQSNLTITNGSICDVAGVDVTDINSSQGRTIWTHRGLISNSNNWLQLPTGSRTIIK